VPTGAKNQRHSQRAGEPRRGSRQISLKIEIEQAERHRGKAAGRTDRGPQPAGAERQKHEPAEAQTNQGGEEPDPTDGRIGDNRDGGDAEGNRDHETPRLAHEIALLLLKGAQFARVVDRVADIAERLEQRLRPRDAGVVFDERLLMGQAHGDLVDARQPAQCLFNRASA